MSKKLHIKTFGCQMNAYNSGRMAEVLEPAGYVLTEDQAQADLVILNTCHIREKAAEKVYSELGRARLIKQERQREGRDTLIAVAGCVAQAEGAEIMARARAVDIVVGPQSYHRLAALVAEASTTGKKLVATDFPAEDKFAHLPERCRAKVQMSAFVTVQEGCDKFCTFCVVPYTRGAEFSRTPCRRSSPRWSGWPQAGAREITLLGQNVNAYHGAGPDGRPWTLAKLLRRLAASSGDRAPALHHQPPARHGRRADRAVRRRAEADALSASALSVRLRPHPQGDEPQAHGRRLRGGDRKVRAARPDLALSTDIIVGFPGETDADFEPTVALVAKAASLRPSPSNIAHGREPPRRTSRTKCPSR